MKLQEVFDKLASDGGGQAATSPQDGTWEVAVGEAVVRLAESEDGELVLAWAAIGSLPAEPRTRDLLAERLLEKSFLGLESGGAVFSANDGDIYLHKFARLDDITPETLPGFLDAMLDAADDLVEEVKDIEIKEADHDEVG